MNTDKLTRMGRRRFLRTLSGLGVSTVALKYLSQDGLAELTDDPEEEVPRLGKLVHADDVTASQLDGPPEREPRYYTISRQKWVDVEGTTNAAENIHNRINQEYNTDGIRVGVSASSDHPSGREISVHYIIKDEEDSVIIPSVPFDTLAENLPDHVDGDPGSENPNEIVENIPVKANRKHIEIDFYDSEYRPIPSGCQVAPGFCTIGYRAYHNGLGEWMQTTAGHCVETEGRNVGQPTSSEHIGSAYEVYDRGVNNGLDAATIRMPNERTTPDFAANGGNYRGWSIRGIVTEEELRDHIGDSNYTISKQGIATGLSSGTVETVYSFNHDFVTSANRAGGDSGGPHYQRNGSFVYIAGTHWGGTSTSANATKVESVESLLNVRV